jgi:alpha-1,3-rhamnosyl/mannosyltransferase
VNKLSRVLIDARMVRRTPHGIARYVSRLAEGLLALRDRGALAYEPAFLVAPDCAEPVFARFATLEARTPIHDPRELFELPGLVRKSGAALYHSPSYSSVVACPCPWLVTVHDLNHLHYGGLAQKAYYYGVLRPFARGARRLLTVSRFSRDELATWTGLPAARIGVVHNALEAELAEPVPSAESAPVLARFGLTPGRYFLALSNPKPHKNLPLLLEAYRALGDGAWPLVLSVREKFAGALSTGPLTDREARVLLRSAGALVFPSLYEGFGLPPVESLVAGVPAVVSDIPPHREAVEGVFANAGEEGSMLWVDPRDRAAWTAALRAAPVSLRRPGPEVAARLLERYSTARLASEMDRIYRDVLKEIV